MWISRQLISSWKCQLWVNQHNLIHVTYSELYHLQTQNKIQPNYQNKYIFTKMIDQLPTGPEWMCKLVRPHGNLEAKAVAGDEEEELELWMHNLVTCIFELIGNMSYHGNMMYTPEKVYTNQQGRCQWYNKIWTREWSWEVQVSHSGYISSTHYTFIIGPFARGSNHCTCNFCIW